MIPSILDDLVLQMNIDGVQIFKSCGKSTDIKRLERITETQKKELASLNNKLDSIPEIIRVEKINIHLDYDSWISSKDRGQQLMELHQIVKTNIKDLQK